MKGIKEKLITALETEVNLTATTIITGEQPIIVRKEHCQSLEESIVNMLDTDDDYKKYESQISDMKATLLIEYVRKKDYQ